MINRKPWPGVSRYAHVNHTLSVLPSRDLLSSLLLVCGIDVGVVYLGF